MKAHRLVAQWTRLTYYLIAKSIIDVLLIAILALGFYLAAFNPNFHGWVDDANARWVRGWVINRAAPVEDVEAQLYIDGRFIESQTANQSRPDIVASHLAESEQHGFFFLTPRFKRASTKLAFTRFMGVIKDHALHYNSSASPFALSRKQILPSHTFAAGLMRLMCGISRAGS